MTRLAPLAALLCTMAAPLFAQEGQVVFERTGYRLTSLGGRVSVAARVLDARRRAVPNAPIAWRIEDSLVASVDRRGVVQSKRVGRTRLWAVSGRDSASALILVDQWAARFAFQPAVISFASVGSTRPVQVQARDASGNAIPGVRVATACRVANPRVATLSPAGVITANASGSTWLRCADRGIADSARIEVRPRPATAEIENKAVYSAQRLVGDSFQVRVRVLDSARQVIADARPTFASAEPRVLSIDPLTGWARGVGVGASRIIAQVGDITDTVDVNVVAPAGMNIAPVVTAGEPEEAAAAPVARASVSIVPILTAVGDTVSVVLTARDASGGLADASETQLRLSGDTTIARLLSDRRLVALREGQVSIIGTYAGVTDSTPVRVGPAGSISRSFEIAESFVRPSYDTATARARNRTQIDSAMQSILSGSSVRVGRGRMVSAQALMAQAAHGVRLSTSDVERRSGILYGGRLVAAPFSKLRLSSALRMGTLSPDASSATAEEISMTEVEGALTFTPAAWVSLEAGGMVRGMSTAIAAQRWTLATTSLVFHPRLIGERFSTVFGFTVMPAGTLSESDTSSRSIEPSFGGDAGLEFRTGFFNAALLYHSERIGFPVKDGVKREDRFSMLRVRIGFQLGR